MSTNTRIYIANLGKYNEGKLVGGWLDLPFTEEEQQKLFLEIKLAHLSENGEYKEGFAENGSIYEEYAIHDYETDCSELKIGEYDSITELNEQVEAMDNLDDYECNALRAYLENGYDFEDALQHVQDSDFMYYSGCGTMTEVAEQYADETGLLNSIPENLQLYFDFEAFGRDMGFEGTFIFIDDDCIQLL